MIEDIGRKKHPRKGVSLGKGLWRATNSHLHWESGNPASEPSIPESQAQKTC